MNDPRCEYCGHYNHAAAEFCEACEFPLGAGPAAGAAPRAAGGPSAQPTAADDIPSPPFKSAGDVIKPMLAVYRKHFTLIGILVLVTMVPEALLQYGILDASGAAAEVGVGGRGGAHAVGRGVGSLLLWLLALVCGALLSGSLVYAVVDLQRAGRASAGECLSRGLKALPKLLRLTLLYSVVVLVGYVLLVVPGVIFSLMFAVSIPAAVVEGLGPVAAMKRSHALTSGYKGLIFITTFLWGLLILALNWIVIGSFASGGKLDLLPTLLLQTSVLGMLNSSAHVLTVYVYLGLLRERRDGFQAGAFGHDAQATG